jgi:dipeptidyl aminopeptidase/acylaminoacyl peptidase
VRVSRGLLALGLLGVTACATREPPAPLLDRELFFDEPEISGALLSPDGAFLSFRKPHRGVMNIWLKRREEPFEAARPLTADQRRPVKAHFWSRDSRWLLYAQDRDGDENYHVYAVDPQAPADPATGVPPARDLTPYGPVRAQLLSLPDDRPDLMVAGLNDRDPRAHDVYRIDLLSGRRTLVWRNDQGIASWQLDRAGDLRLAIRRAADGGTEFLRVDGRQLVPAYRCGPADSCGSLRVHEDGRRVYLASNRGDADLTALVLLDPVTGREERVESDPEGQVDLSHARFSEKTHRLVATHYDGDRMRTYPRDPAFQRDYQIVRRALPDGDLMFGSSSADDRRQLVTLGSDRDPGATYLYDRASATVRLLYRPRPRLPAEHLAAMQPVRYRARDGLEIPAYLTLPRGLPARGLPAVVLPHGGPWERDSWGYSSWAQFLANRGYAVLQPNFRGSAGYGKRFLNLGNEQWGTGSMQHDLTDGVAWLVRQGIADPARIAIAGTSYGGYATLAGVAFTPGLYAAAVDVVGPSSLVTLLQSLPSYWAPLRKIFSVRVGDLDDPADLPRLRAQSPLHAAAAIRTPLLVIQGANDPRVKRAESDQIVRALHGNHRPVEYLVAPDEGHGFSGRENRVAMFVAIERFLARHLHGRCQQTVPAPIAARLTQLTVDPAQLGPTASNLPDDP